jgi:hypothetical protein
LLLKNPNLLSLSDRYLSKARYPNGYFFWRSINCKRIPESAR